MGVVGVTVFLLDLVGDGCDVRGPLSEVVATGDVAVDSNEGGGSWMRSSFLQAVNRPIANVAIVAFVQ